MPVCVPRESDRANWYICLRWDKVYRCVSWVWELWQLYNNYMKQLDLTELSLGNYSDTLTTTHTVHHIYTTPAALHTVYTSHKHNQQATCALLSLCAGLKHMLQCPVESGSSDSIQRFYRHTVHLISLQISSVLSWLCQLWEHHVVPRVEETLLHSRRMEGQHHQQTVNLLLRAMINRAIRPTCPLDIAGWWVHVECFHVMFRYQNVSLCDCC